jgi:hypothetical protein
LPPGRDLRAYHKIAAVQLDPAHAGSAASHRTDIAFIEANGHALARGKENIVGSVGFENGNERIALVERQRADPRSACRVELLQPQDASPFRSA